MTRKKIVPVNVSNPEEALEAGIPYWIVFYVNHVPVIPLKGFDVLPARLERFVDFWRKNPDAADEFRRHWRALEKGSIGGRIFDLFIDMPDGPGLPPFLDLRPKSTLDVGERRARYQAGIEQIDALSVFVDFKGDLMYPLSFDAGATGGEAKQAYRQFDDARKSLADGLRKLRATLQLVDPAASSPTKHWKAVDAEKKNYVYFVARLNHILVRPQHAALAFLANVNCPAVQIDKDLVRKAWERGTEKSLLS